HDVRPRRRPRGRPAWWPPGVRRHHDGLARSLSLALVGVSALIAASPLAFDVLRWASAAYLIWIGVPLFARAWRDRNAALAAGTRRSSRPQTSRLGALTRWMRFFRPLSGIGQMNFPVVPIAHMSRTRASVVAASCASVRGNMRRAASPSGSRKM